MVVLVLSILALKAKKTCLLAYCLDFLSDKLLVTVASFCFVLRVRCACQACWVCCGWNLTNHDFQYTWHFQWNFPPYDLRNSHNLNVWCIHTAKYIHLGFEVLGLRMKRNFRNYRLHITCYQQYVFIQFNS